MNLLLSHFGLEPLVYGVIVFLGLALMWWKLITLHLVSLAIDIVVFIAVFSMHGGTLQGGMAAAVAALLAGIFFPLVLRLR
jgi:hypothetical protein